MSGVGVGAADDPVAANGTLELEEGQYDRENGTVRVQTAFGEDPEYQEIAYLQHVRFECEQVANRRVGELVDARYGASNHPVWTAIDSDGIAVSTRYHPRFHPDYLHLQRTVPSHVRVTLRVGNGTETCTVPIRVEGRRSGFET